MAEPIYQMNFEERFNFPKTSCNGVFAFTDHESDSIFSKFKMANPI